LYIQFGNRVKPAARAISCGECRLKTSKHLDIIDAPHENEGIMTMSNMTLDPYYHEHVGVEEVPWSRLAQWLPNLVQKIGNDWHPEVAVGIAKGGVIPAVYLSSVFRLDVFQLSRDFVGS